MPYSDRMQKSHLYTVFFSPRGYIRMADLGMQIAQQYLSPFDKLIGMVGDAGSGKSMLVRGMFPGLELVNDDGGVNTRPLPLLSAVEDDASAFYSAHTYHVDIRFESAFTQMHVLAEAILGAVDIGKRVVVEHFDLIYPFLNRNAHLLIGMGEEVIVTRPTLFGPEPKDIADVVFKSLPYRRMIHSAEDLTALMMAKQGVKEEFLHSDVRHGFIFNFQDKPDIDLNQLEKDVLDLIERDVTISYLDDDHISIDGKKCACHGPRMHVRTAKEIGGFKLNKEFLVEQITGRYMLVGMVGDLDGIDIHDLNRIGFDEV